MQLLSSPIITSCAVRMLKSLVCVSLLFVTDAVVCKPDYLFNKEVDGWLKLHKVPATWQEAFETCHYEGAVLSSPNTDELASALYSILRESEVKSPIFLGVNAVTRGVFMSIEGVPLSDLSITWGIYGDGNCLVLSTDGKTFISSCLLSLPYICYRKRDQKVLNECGTFDNDYQLYATTGSCYKYHKSAKTWFTAYKICAAEGGHLVIINDTPEAKHVASYLDNPLKPDMWDTISHIGLRDWTGDFTWLTIHGEKVEDVYNVWAKDQPDNLGVNVCGAIYQDATLDDIHCSNFKKSFVCEKNPNASRFETISNEGLEAATSYNN